MYEIMILLNFSAETTWQIFIEFHVDPTVETGLRACSNSHAPLTAIPIYGKNNDNKRPSCSKPRTAQMLSLSLVAMTGLEKCCIYNICSGYFT